MKVRLKKIEMIINENLDKLQSIRLINDKIVSINFNDFNVVKDMIPSFNSSKVYKVVDKRYDFYELEDGYSYHKDSIAKKVKEIRYDKIPKTAKGFEIFVNLVKDGQLYYSYKSHPKTKSDFDAGTRLKYILNRWNNDNYTYYIRNEV